MDTWLGWCRGVLDINDPCYIVTSSRGRNIVVNYDLTIKVFDNRGKFEKCFRIPALLADNENIKIVFKIAVVWSTFCTCVNLIYALMVSDAEIIGFIAKLNGNSKVSSRQP